MALLVKEYDLNNWMRRELIHVNASSIEQKFHMTLHACMPSYFEIIQKKKTWGFAYPYICGGQFPCKPMIFMKMIKT